MCMLSLEECHCNCHSNPGYRHCFPCCRVCPTCGGNIVSLAFKDHAKKCKKNYENLPEELRKNFKGKTPHTK